jgi:hypothetical protein
VGALFALVLWAGCGNDEAKLEEWADGAWRERAFSSYDIDGKRDGDRTRATATFTLVNGEKLRIELVVGYDPTPVLARSSWSLDGLVYQTTSVVSMALKFTGGQGEGPSLGGRFMLEADGQNRFRVVLPVLPIEKVQWKRE